MTYKPGHMMLHSPRFPSSPPLPTGGEEVDLGILDCLGALSGVEESFDARRGVFGLRLIDLTPVNRESQSTFLPSGLSHSICNEYIMCIVA